MKTLISTIQFQESKENESQRKRLKHFNLVCDLLEQDEKGTSPVAPLSDGDKETEKYLDHRRNDIGSFGLLDTMKDLYLLLFPVVSGILCTPASTAPM